MTWLSFDDGYTRERVWDDIPHDTRWHFHAIVETCCATRRYDGRLRWSDALRCSDVTDPARSVKELLTAGLLLDLGSEVEVENIDNFLPPEGERPENLLARKRRNQAAYRRRKCERGEHSKDCPRDCPARAQRVLSGVTERVTGNAGSGRVGSGSTKTEGRVPHLWIPDEFAAPSGSEAAGGGTTPAPAGVHPPTPSHSGKPEHDGPEPDGPGVQQISNRGTSRAQPADRNVRARAACWRCGRDVGLRNGIIVYHKHGASPCRGAGMPPRATGPAEAAQP